MSLPMDPSECPWTPEGEELRSDLQLKCQAMLEQMQEENERLDYELLQYPYKPSH